MEEAGMTNGLDERYVHYLLRAATITSVTATMQKLLDQADREKLLPLLAQTTRSFDATSKEAGKFLVDGQQLLADLKQVLAGFKCHK